jgi:nicotinate-nucleotide adenylyltransferase
MSERKRIALFGGTFDPVHLGHVHLAMLAKEAAQLDEIHFLPCRISPHKLGQSTAPAADRLEMLKLATRNLPWAQVNDFELTGPAPSFSYLTAETLAAREPEAAWFWLMGGDQWDALPQWRHPERLAAVVTFLVLARGREPRPRQGVRMQVVPGDHPASATAIRAGVQSSTHVVDWLNPEVFHYLREHHLYRTEPRLAPGKTSE